MQFSQETMNIQGALSKFLLFSKNFNIEHPEWKIKKRKIKQAHMLFKEDSTKHNVEIWEFFYYSDFTWNQFLGV